jgi:PTS system nitrogen regulatory IIA component
MSDLGDLIAPEAVTADLSVTSKRALFQALGRLAHDAMQLDEIAVTQRLSDREKLGTTGFGSGVAIPHAKLPELDRVRGAFVRLARPIGYSAVDNLPVDLVLLLLSPEDSGADHLKALARVSRRLRDASLAAKLRGAQSRDAIYALLTGGEPSHGG